MNLTKETKVTGVRKNKAGKITAFNINRKTWGRGKRCKRGGFLLDVVLDTESGKPQINMCCLGVFSRACGLSPARIKEKLMPSLITGVLPESLQVFIKQGYNTNLARLLASYNDSNRTSDKVKETQIIKGFAKVGIKVRFVGKG